MQKEEKYIKKVKDDRVLSERIAMMIPGFRGYKEKELRRDTDQLIRDKVYSTLKMGLKDLQWCYRELINANIFNQSDQLNRLIMKTDKLSKKIHHAERGYSGIWQSIKTKEGELTELLQYDASLIDISEKMRNDISQIKDEMKKKNFDELFKLIENCEQAIDKFDDKFSDREEVIKGLTKGGE
ncbi:MAG: hypothetical protein MUO82_06410 [Candidatus Thermoplasmatota archaeon]|nr:hypothetical protein [Candidatus Thermoplasmatota archaeon]